MDQHVVENDFKHLGFHTDGTAMKEFASPTKGALAADSVVIEAGYFSEIFAIKALEHGLVGTVSLRNEETFRLGVDIWSIGRY